MRRGKKWIFLFGVAISAWRIASKAKRANKDKEDIPAERNPFEGKKVCFVRDDNDPVNADGEQGHLEELPLSRIDTLRNHVPSFYELYVKRKLDLILSFIGLVVLFPLLLVIGMAIYIDDPGPVLFTQKRIGKNKRYFLLHKFRTMKQSTPHDVPTHMLKDPESYITRVGKFLRKTSLDELPQIWDIFIGNMSIVGPRPALWNQDVLTAERDLYGANDIMPGLTGWAQVNGRDELEIPDKAKLDGEYCQKLSIRMDIICILLTIANVVKHSGVVEGGTGSMPDHLGGLSDKSEE